MSGDTYENNVEAVRQTDSDGCVDVDDLVDKIQAINSRRRAIQDGQTTEQKTVNEAIVQLRAMQAIQDTKETAERFRKMTESKRHTDAFSNPAASTGWGEENLINATKYPLTRLTQDWQLLTSLYRTSWIVQRVCNVIPEDAMTDLTIEVPDLEQDEITKISEELRTTHVRESLLEALCWGRLYGGSAAIIMVSGQEEDLSKPLDVDNIMPGAFRGLYIVDRWSGIYPSLDLVDNERDPDFGLPDYYEVRDENGGGNYRVHHSRVLRFCGTKMPYWEQVAEQYWGTSAIESMYDELVKRDNVAHNIANLTFKANLNVLKVENLDQMFATSSTVHQHRMYQMLSAINTIENSLGIRLINSTDDIQQLQYSFSGLPEVMDSAMMDMAGATCIPATRLFGRSPAGMNSTGESDEKMYRQTLEHERAIHIHPALDRLLPIICHSSIGRFPQGAKFKLPPLIEMSQVDKVQLIDQQSNTIERLFQANLIPGDVVLESFRNSQLALDMTSPIKDEHIEKVRGKYMNDLQQQADPYGGAMQSAGEAGAEQPQTDENGNPVEQQVDENGNPVEQQVDENGNPIEPQEGEDDSQMRAMKAQYKPVVEKAPPAISRDIVAQAADLENISPAELSQNLRKRYIELKKQKKRMREYQRVLKSVPNAVTNDLVSELAAAQELSPEELEQQIVETRAQKDPKFAQQLARQQEQGQAPEQEQQPQEQGEQREDSLPIRRRRRRHDWL